MSNAISRSREGAWIEMVTARKNVLQGKGRSREGAWIEIYSQMSYKWL